MPYPQDINKKKMIIFNIVFRRSKNVQNKSSGYKQVFNRQKIVKIKVRPEKRRTIISNRDILQKKEALSMSFLKKFFGKRKRKKIKRRI